MGPSDAHVDMPDTLINVVGTGSSANFCCIAPNCVIPVLSLEEPDRF
jgi:hypothetical protein